MRDIAAAAPMTKDTIFRDYSMTKPVTGVAMMILYEQGKWLPTDPIAKYIPEFAHLKVFKGMDSSGKMILVDPDHPPTMRELMTHTAGFTYGFFGDTPVDKMYRDANLLASENLQEIDRQAGEDSAALSARQGLGLQHVDGYPGLHCRKALRANRCPISIRDHIFTPLGMKDAGFFVPEDKRGRFAALYRDWSQRRARRRSERQPAGQAITTAATDAIGRRRLGLHG